MIIWKENDAVKIRLVVQLVDSWNIYLEQLAVIAFHLDCNNANSVDVIVWWKRVILVWSIISFDKSADLYLFHFSTTYSALVDHQIATVGTSMLTSCNFRNTSAYHYKCYGRVRRKRVMYCTVSDHSRFQISNTHWLFLPNTSAVSPASWMMSPGQEHFFSYQPLRPSRLLNCACGSVSCLSYLALE